MEARNQNQLFMSEDEYLRFDVENDFKSEFVNGEVFMAGGASYKHGLIGSNLNTQLSLQLREKDCDTLQETLRIQIKKKKKLVYRYPDVIVVCGTPQFVKGAPQDTITNPTVLVEILSPSTANVDRTDKLDEYKQLDSVQDYLIVAQDEISIIHYYRQSADLWSNITYSTPDSEINLHSIGCTLKLSDVYRRIQFDADDDES